MPENFLCAEGCAETRKTMNIYVNEITGMADAITSMFMSRRSWTREKEMEIRGVCDAVLTRHGRIRGDAPADMLAQYNDWMDRLLKWGWMHVTMLRFIDISVTVEGLHRAGQDDWDSHAARFNNRIIRSSTRLASFDYEMSSWYQDKIIPTDQALALLGLETPEALERDGERYVKTVNGYIKEELKDDSDVRRGLYMLSIPSNFIFKVNLTEWAHVYKERNSKGGANPEVKLCCETIADQLGAFQPKLDRALFEKIKN